MQKIIAAAAASVLLAACGSPARIQETATSVPQRDLTLSPTITETQVASKIELAVPATAHRSKPSRTVTRVRLPVAAKTAVVSPAPAPTPAPEVVTPAVAPTPTAVAASPRLDPNSHELAPGATVTIVPVSTASSSPSGAGATGPKSHRQGRAEGSRSVAGAGDTVGVVAAIMAAAARFPFCNNWRRVPRRSRGAIQAHPWLFYYFVRRTELNRRRPFLGAAAPRKSSYGAGLAYARVRRR